MKHTRVIVSRYGGPDALTVLEEERPEPRHGHVRVRVLSAGVALPDIMAREGIHPETPRVPITPGWDLVGVVDRLGAGVSGIAPGQIVAAMPISGAYAEFVCLPEGELVPVPSGLDPAETVSLVLNYITAYQMLHRSAGVTPGQRVLIHGAAGGVGTALLQLGRLAGLELYGTCSSRGASAVSDLGGVPIDYQNQDFVEEIHRLTREGVDAVFDPIGGPHLWQSRKALRPGGRVVGYGLVTSIRGEGLTSGRPGHRRRFRGTAIFGLYIVGGWSTCLRRADDEPWCELRPSALPDGHVLSRMRPPDRTRGPGDGGGSRHLSREPHPCRRASRFRLQRTGPSERGVRRHHGQRPRVVQERREELLPGRAHRRLMAHRRRSDGRRLPPRAARRAGYGVRHEVRIGVTAEPEVVYGTDFRVERRAP